MVTAEHAKRIVVGMERWNKRIVKFGNFSSYFVLKVALMNRQHCFELVTYSTSIITISRNSCDSTILDCLTILL